MVSPAPAEPPHPRAPDQPFDGRALVATLPHAPGVYRMYDAAGSLLYVGKAKDLKKRVGSYFFQPHSDPRIQALIGHIRVLEFAVTRTEAEALVLEAQLIKAQNPRYNIALRDGLGYPYLRLTADHAFPRLTLAYGKTPEGARDFGPFPSREAARAGLDVIQKTFRLRNCSDGFFKSRSRPCLQYSIGRCAAPCVGLIDQQAYRAQVAHAVDFLEGRSPKVIEDLGVRMERLSVDQQYEEAGRLRDQIAALSVLQANMDVSGARTDRDVVAAAVHGDLAGVYVWYFRHGRAVGARSFVLDRPLGGDASELMEQFLSQNYLGAPLPAELIVHPAPAHRAVLEAAFSAQAGRAYHLRARVAGERARHLALAQRNIQATLAGKSAHADEQRRRYEDMIRLLELPFAPQRMECFDISHTRGEAPVASCVVFGPEGPRTSEYRRYNITGITPGDDYAAMGQVLDRRLKSLKENPDRERPDVWFIDGGAGQVAQALEALARYSADGLGAIEVIGVAKGPARRPGDEDLIRPGRETLHPGNGSPGLHFIQFLRDEAHRFAITGHRAKRQGARDHSPLESIPGVGPAKRRALLKAFGGLQGLKAAGADELARVPGVSMSLAERVVIALREV